MNFLLVSPAGALSKARKLAQAQLIEGLEPLLFATYNEYSKWINRLS